MDGCHAAAFCKAMLAVTNRQPGRMVSLVRTQDSRHLGWWKRIEKSKSRTCRRRPTLFRIQPFRIRDPDIQCSISLSNTLRVQSSGSRSIELAEGWNCGSGRNRRDRLGAGNLHDELANDAAQSYCRFS